MKITPAALKEGDVLRIVSTARAISREELQPALELIASWGFKVEFGKNVFLRHNQFAGSDAQRVEDFNEAIRDKNVKAILCARGGYGTARIVDFVDYESLQKNPKWICGYSDVTVLHNHINRNTNLMSCHSSMPVNFKTNSSEALNSLKKVLTGQFPNYRWRPHTLNRAGSAEAEIVGGNLSILYSLSGTPSDIDTEGKILFLEDLDEYLYHIDRMMINLKRSGKLSRLAGLLIGGMSNMNDNIVPFGKSAVEIIFETVAEYDYPVAFDFPAGHIDNNCSLIIGCVANLQVGEQVSLEHKKTES